MRVLEAVRGRAAGGASLGREPPGRELPGSIHRVGGAPQDWLFPRVAAAVQHGGAGTTAAALQAGVPSVVVPFLGDQSLWAGRVHALGAGPAPIPRKRLTTEWLVGAIRAAAGSEAFRNRAGEVGERLRDEGGVARAVGLTDRFVGGAEWARTVSERRGPIH